MKQWKRLAYYLLLNVLVSACTTYGVLLLWERVHTPGVGALISLPLGSSGQAASTTATPPSSTPQPAPTATQVFIVYQVKEGDDFSSIATAYGVSVEELIAENGFTQSQPLGVGEVLRIPVTPTPETEPEVVIESVIGPGDLDSEQVVVRQSGEGDLLLAGWQLDNGKGDVFTFPALELATDGAMVSVYTKAGTNSAGKVFWGLEGPVWGTGDIVTLRDTQGVERASYQVP